ncbi:MAG: ABC transporter ATP-binding protein [Candidatus Woesearchaeota archaeon]|jgi:ABC-2 type transport system ATP-binding protein
MGKEPVLKIEGVSKSYARKQVLENISFEVRQGEILGLIGTSGSGKTTLLNCLVGFVPPDSGEVKFKHENGKVTFSSVYNRPSKFKHLYGFASQIPSFYEKLTVKENLFYFGSLYGLSKDVLKSNVTTLLKLMDLENSSFILGKNLSGGMERRLDIACSLIHNPPLLILDEPTADLDPILRKTIWNILKKVNQKGTTIILSSHHLNEIETLCDRIAILKDGQIIALGTAEELKNKFLKHKEIRIESSPGNYEKLGPFLQKKFKKDIASFEVKAGELILFCEKPQDFLNDLVTAIEQEKEKILELKLVKPSLDQVFITLNKKELKEKDSRNKDGKDKETKDENKNKEEKDSKDKENKEKDTKNKDNK